MPFDTFEIKETMNLKNNVALKMDGRQNRRCKSIENKPTGTQTVTFIVERKEKFQIR